MKVQISLKVGVLITAGGKLLLIKERSSYDDKYHWNIIKGTLEPERDESLIEAIEREAKEEAGVTIKNVKPFNVFEVRKGGKCILQVNFLAGSKSKPQLLSKHGQAKHNEDIVEIKFFNKKALRKMKRRDFINERAHLTVRDWVAGSKSTFRLLS